MGNGHAEDFRHFFADGPAVFFEVADVGSGHTDFFAEPGLRQFEIVAIGLHIVAGRNPLFKTFIRIGFERVHHLFIRLYVCDFEFLAELAF